MVIMLLIMNSWRSLTLAVVSIRWRFMVSIMVIMVMTIMMPVVLMKMKAFIV